MITISKTFEWDMGHRVPNHESLCKNPHGHRYRMNVYVTGKLNEKENDPEQGMVIDFGKLKEVVTSTIVKKLDHSFMYYEKDEVMAAFAKNNPALRMVPVPYVPTAEDIAEGIALELKKIFHKEFPELTIKSIELYETPKSKAIWS